MRLLLLGASLLAVNAAVITVSGTSGATLDSYNAPSAAGLWTIGMTVNGPCPSILGCGLGLTFSDTNGDVLGPQNRTVQMSFLNNTGGEVDSVVIGILPLNTVMFALPTTSDHFNGYIINPYIYFRKDQGPPIPWLPGETLTLSFTLTRSTPVSSFSLGVGPGSGAIPEPSTLTLLGVGAAVLALLRRHS